MEENFAICGDLSGWFNQDFERKWENNGTSPPAVYDDQANICLVRHKQLLLEVWHQQYIFFNLTPEKIAVIMPLTLKKLKGHIDFGLSVHACLHPCVRLSHFLMHATSYELCMLGFLKFHIWILLEK